MGLNAHCNIHPLYQGIPLSCSATNPRERELETDMDKIAMEEAGGDAGCTDGVGAGTTPDETPAIPAVAPDEALPSGPMPCEGHGQTTVKQSIHVFWDYSVDGNHGLYLHVQSTKRS